MARKVRTTLLYVIVPIVFFASMYYYFLEESIPFFVNPNDIPQQIIGNLSMFESGDNMNISQGNLSVSNKVRNNEAVVQEIRSVIIDDDKKKKKMNISQGNLSVFNEVQNNEAVVQENRSVIIDDGKKKKMNISQGDLSVSNEVRNNEAVVQEIRSVINDGKKKRKKNLPELIPISKFSTVSVLMPDWEVLVIVSPEDTHALASSLRGHENDFVCVHYTREVTPANFSRSLAFPDRVTFRCLLVGSAKKTLPLKQPALLTLSEERNLQEDNFVVPPKILLIWSNLVYDTLTPEDADDHNVIVFAKGLIKKQDTVRAPSEFECIFGDDVVNGVITPVKTSKLEVFRCERPKLTDFPSSSAPIKVSLRILTEKRVVPSVAYYTPTPRRLGAPQNRKALLCACTMVYNIAKFLKEWVYYHAKIGVEKFILYDNGSDDDLASIVYELNQQGYDVSTYFWLWQKTQEAGFSHSALYAKESCKWMMYLDVDEFVYSPKWSNSPKPSISMLQSMLKDSYDNNGIHKLFENSRSFHTSSSSLKLHREKGGKPVGQISILCREFGPSNQSIHPIMGVTQGYNCRMGGQNRHKSIVLLEAVDDCLSNVVHHFKLKKEYRTVLLSMKKIMVNHYKYQAWEEFKAKFKRRVSAYVVDWNSEFNLNSQDRPKGFSKAFSKASTMVEPQNWKTSYCQVHDNRLRDLVWRWFATKAPLGYRLPWQR